MTTWNCLNLTKIFSYFRLNITPPPSPVFGDKFNKKRPNKRPRTEDLQATTTSTTTAATGNVQIIEADSQGKFVRLFNSGTKVCMKKIKTNFAFSIEKLK
jgi:hypothetical protein